ncbi:hypothetical protein Efla_007217 [Eimeria flavescens]
MSFTKQIPPAQGFLKMQKGNITSTPTPRARSALPCVPQSPLLLHPHKPLLFAAHGSCMRLFNYETQQWILDELQQQQQPQRQQQQGWGTRVAAADNPLLADEQQQQQQQQQQRRHTMDVSAADCVCLACGCRSSNFPVYARAPCSSSSGGSSSGSSSSGCLWITTGDEKSLCLWSDESFELLQRRVQRKKASAVCFFPVQQQQHQQQQQQQEQQQQQQQQQQQINVVLCDKFGDVFLLPLETLGGQQRLAGDVLLQQMKAEQQRQKQHRLSSSSSSSGQQQQDAAESTDDDCEEDVPVMAHLTTVTCLKLVSLNPKQQQQQQQQQEGVVLLTGDRDEKVRVCFACSPWRLEAAHLGHRDFITDVAVISSSSSNDSSSGSNSSSSSSSSSNSSREEGGEDALQQHLVVSAAADCCLRLWRMHSGAVCPQGLLSLNPAELFGSQLKHIAPLLQQQLQQQQQQQLKLPAVLQGHLLPIKVFADEPQQLLVVQTLQLQGLLLISYNVPPQQQQQQHQQQQQQQGVFKGVWAVPLSFNVGAALVARHSLSEIQSLPIFARIRQQQEQQQQQQQGSVLIAWLVDTEGRLQPPVCLELSLLSQLQQQQQQQEERSVLLPLLQGISPPIPHEQQQQQQQQKQRTCYWWKQTRDPEAPTIEDRRAKRLRHKHMQQQQQQQHQQQQQQQQQQ